MANPGDDNELIKAAVEGVARGVTDSVLEPFKLMAGGFCREIGAGLGYVGTYFRIKIGLKVMERARLMLREAGVEGQSVAPKVFVPLIESASLEEDDDLQERWAALLANAADPKQEDVPASFPGILKDLSPQEAKLLDAIYGDPRHAPTASAQPTPIGNWDSLLGIYLTRVWTNRQSGIIPHEEFSLGLNNLVRLQLIERRINLHDLSQLSSVLPHSEFDTGAAAREALRAVAGARESYVATTLGSHFVAACRPPRRPGN